MGSDSPNLYLYITKSWSAAFNAAVLTLRHINYHVIFKYIYIYIYNFSFNFKIVFTIFSPINAAYYLFIYFHYHSIIIQPTSYLFSSTIKPNPKSFQFSLKEKKKKKGDQIETWKPFLCKPFQLKEKKKCGSLQGFAWHEEIESLNIVT